MERFLINSKDILNNFDKFVLVDDLLATGGTAKCVYELLSSINKKVLGIYVIVELLSLKGRDKIDVPIYSALTL